MDIKKLYNSFIYYLTVPKCVCCRERLDIDDEALCKACLKEYKNIKLANCSVCSHTLERCSCVNDYLDKHYVHKLVKLFRYKQPAHPNDRMPANELIYNIKRGKRRDLLKFITDELVEAIEDSVDYKKFIITNVPRKRSRVTKYGLDHSAEIAKSISKRLGIDYVKTLKSSLKKPQKKTHGEERLKNARFDYLRNSPDIKGKNVLLVDDIVTTGASMGNCAMLLHGLGAKRIVGVCLSIAYKDKYTPFITDARNKR